MCRGLEKALNCCFHFFLFALQLIDEKKNIMLKHTVSYVEPFTHVCFSDGAFSCQVTANQSIGRGRART